MQKYVFEDWKDNVESYDLIEKWKLLSSRKLENVLSETSFDFARNWIRIIVLYLENDNAAAELC